MKNLKVNRMETECCFLHKAACLSLNGAGRYLLYAILLFACIILSQSGALAATVTIASNVPGATGGVASVSVSLDNVSGQGIIANELTIKYNPAALTLRDVESGVLTSAWMADTRLYPAEVMDPPFIEPLMYKVTILSATEAEAKIAIYGAEPDLSGAGDIAHLVFDINPSAPMGVTNISLTRGDLNGGLVASSLVSGSVNVMGVGIPGDLNGDTVVDVRDVRLAINIALGSAPQDLAADLNGDLVVDIRDVRLIINIALS